MLTELPFQFSGRVFRSAMPFGPFDHQDQIWHLYRENEVDTVVVLAEPAEYLAYTQRDLPSFYNQQGLEVIHVPVPDHGLPPDKEGFHSALQTVLEKGEEGQHIAVHCLAGIGRTGTFLACLARENYGYSGQEAIHWVRKQIPGALENQDQEQFVMDYACEVKRC